MKDIELFQEVLEVLESLHRTGDTQAFDLCAAPVLIPALRERLAQPEQTATYTCGVCGVSMQMEQPAQQPLTDEQDAKRWQFLRSAGDDVTLRLHNSRSDQRDSVIDAAIELRKAAEQSLKALEEYQSKGAPFMSCDAAVNALRAALAQPPQQEKLMPITDDHGQALRPQYRVVEQRGDWVLLYDQFQLGEAVRHEFRIQKLTHDIALYPGITLAEAQKRFREKVESDSRGTHG